MKNIASSEQVEAATELVQALTIDRFPYFENPGIKKSPKNFFKYPKI